MWYSQYPFGAPMRLLTSTDLALRVLMRLSALAGCLAGTALSVGQQSRWERRKSWRYAPSASNSRYDLIPGPQKDDSFLDSQIRTSQIQASANEGGSPWQERLHCGMILTPPRCGSWPRIRKITLRSGGYCRRRRDAELAKRADGYVADEALESRMLSRSFRTANSFGSRSR